MDASSLLLKAVLQVLAKQIQESNNRVSLLLETELPKITASLSRIEHALEENRIAPLRAAVTCLRIGDESGALQRLIDAEAADPSAAVPSFWLGLLLYGRGQYDLAEEKLSKAIRLNPKVIPSEWIPNELLSSGNALGRDRERWSIDVVQSVSRAAPTVYGKLWGFRTGMGGEARVAGAGLSTASLIVLVETPNPSYPCLSSINLLSGKVEWTQRLPTIPNEKPRPRARLLGVSPTHIAVFDPNTDRVLLHDVLSGSHLRSVGEAYLRAMMFPLPNGGSEDVVVFTPPADPFAEPLIEILQREQLDGPGFSVEITNQYRITSRPKGRSDRELYIESQVSIASRYDQ